MIIDSNFLYREEVSEISVPMFLKVSLPTPVKLVV